MQFFNWKIRYWTGLWLGGGEGEATKVGVYLAEDSWYWLVLEFFAWNCCTQICDWLSHIPLPKFICNWERNWSGYEDGDAYLCTFEQWVGSTLSGPWHCWVESPFCQWVWKHKNPQQIPWKMTLGEARTVFANCPEDLAWIDKEIAERNKRAEENSVLE